MDDKMEKSLLEDYFDRITFSPTPIPRKKLDLNKIASNMEYNMEDYPDSDKFLGFDQSVPKFDLIVSCDQNKFVTSTMPLPRKPRKKTKNKHELNDNHYEETLNDSFFFFNNSYSMTSTKLSETPTHLFINEIKQILPDSFKDIYDLNRTKNLPKNNSFKLERPTAPPPPPPQIVHPMFSLYESNSVPNTKSHYLNSKLSSIQTNTAVYSSSYSAHDKILDSRKKFISIGFDNLINEKTSQKNNFYKKLTKFFKLKIKFFKIRPSMYDYLVSFLAFILFLTCIISISFFQSKANQFYQKFLNKNNQFHENNSNSTDSLEYFSAGSDMVKQTILLCNGPYFSYQMNNLIVLPFSLSLIIIFSFIDGQKCFRKSYLRRPSLPKIMSPFQRKNRFLIAALYCILANEIFKIIESSLFQTSYSESHNKTLEFLSSLSDWNSTKFSNQSNADFLKIGLGIEPDAIQRKTRIYKTTKKITRPFFMAPSIIHHSKPTLRPRLNLSNFENNVPHVSVSNIINLSHSHLNGELGEVNMNLNVAESIKKYNYGKNKSIETVNMLNQTLVDSSNQTLFQFSMSLYQNKYIQSIVQRLLDSKQFRWILIWQKLEKIAFILIEVIIIGLRYYPFMGILNKNSFVCLILACFYIWFDLLYNIALTGLCEGLKLNVNLDILKEIRRIFGVGFVYDAKEYLKANIGGKILKNGVKSEPLMTKSDQMSFDANFLFSPNRILYSIIKSLPHFFCLSYVSVKLTASLGKMIYSKIKKKNKQSNKKYYERYFDQKYVLGSIGESDFSYKVYNQIVSKNQLNFEDRYVKNLFKKSNKQNNFIKRYLSLIFDQNFCFSTRVVCTYTVCFTVLYYFNCFLIFYGSIFVDLIYLPCAYKKSILFSCLFTSTICAIQLILSIRQFKTHLKNLYKGIKEFDNENKIFSSSKTAARSFSYSGLAVTYTCWGYIILFFFITFIFFQVTTLIEFGGTKMAFILVLIIFPFFVSVISFKLMNRFMVTLATKFCFYNNKNMLTIKSLKMYSIFLYFKFFYDCFTGIALCFARMIKSIALSILYLPRLDYSFMGRNMEKMDTAFMSYIGYLHWESKHTNAIVISFCRLMLKTSKKKYGRVADSDSYIRVRNKWQLLFFLYKNPSLKNYRIK